MGADTDLATRIERIEALEAIRSVAVKYCLAVDDRDYDVLRTLFTKDAVLRTKDGRIKGDDLDSVVGYFVDHMPDLGPSNHFTHGHVVDFDPADPGKATGIVVSHAELISKGRPMITAMRYYDTYRKEDGNWKFAERIQTYMYFVDVREYSEALGAVLRVRNGAEPKPADWPDLSAQGWPGE